MDNERQTAAKAPVSLKDHLRWEMPPGISALLEDNYFSTWSQLLHQGVSKKRRWRVPPMSTLVRLPREGFIHPHLPVIMP